MNEDEFEYTPPEIAERAAEFAQDLLPSTSRERYQVCYEKFIKWKDRRNQKSLSENVILAYFEELSQKYKATTLWSQYSMLKSTINIKHNTDISKYQKLLDFVRRQAKDYVPKKSRILTPEDFHTFLNTAPDSIYLLVKAVVGIGLAGACRREELCQLKVDDIQDLQSAFLIKIKQSKSKLPRSFTITGSFYEICKKYANLRPSNIMEKRFFLNYKNGKCTKQVVGINKIGGMAREIAAFLRIPNFKEYTGHCFRRSSATMLVKGGGDLLTLERHGKWLSSTVAEGYIRNSFQHKIYMSNAIVGPAEPCGQNPEES